MICNRCMTTNQLINHQGDFCTGCGQKFMRNMIGFDTLPLVEFAPPAGLPHKRVLECLRQDPPEDGGGFSGMSRPGKKAGGRHQDGWQENGNGEEQTLTFNNNQEEDMDNDLFT